MQASAIARGLAAEGVGPGQVVGLWMARGIDLLVAQIAITLSGAAWLPFDADAPVERIADCLSDCGAALLVTEEAWLAKAEGAGVAVRSPAALTRADDGADLGPRAAGLTPDHPAYMIYTSGSTGKPKGIVVSHRNICHFLRAAADAYGLNGEDVVFQGASVAFDLSMEEIWAPYVAGATLHVATPKVMGDVENLPRVLEEAGVTVIDTVPTLLGVLPRDVATLRIIILGGEALPPAIVQKWAREGRRIFNTYGPTEATVVATIAEVEPGRPVTIGRPIANYSCYVVDGAGRLCGEGEQGELWIGGPGVAVGYLQRPDLTAEKFVDNPFGGVTDPRLYRSGDAVSMTAEGEIAFHGRIDDQVKIRGFRVELGEIEVKLSEEPGVAQAAVALRTENGVDKLVAFLVAEPGASLDRPAIRAALRAKLPPYMIPAITSRSRPCPPRRLRQGGPQDAEGPAAHRGRGLRRGRGARERDRGRAGRGRQAALQGPGPPVRGRFLHRHGRPFADRGPVHLGRAPDAAPCDDHPAGRLRAAHAARHRGRAGRARGGPWRRGPEPVLRAAPVPPPLPLRAGAGRRHALHPWAGDDPVAGSVLVLDLPDQGRFELPLRDGGALLHLCGAQSRREGADRRAEMGDPRPHQARPLPALGRLLLPRLAGAAPHPDHHAQVPADVPAAAALDPPARRQGRPGGDHLRVRGGRLRPHHHRRPRLDRLEGQDGECRVHRQRDDHRPGRDRRLRLCRQCLRDLGRRQGERRRRAQGPDLRAAGPDRPAWEIWDGSPPRKVGEVDRAAARASGGLALRIAPRGAGSTSSPTCWC